MLRRRACPPHFVARAGAATSSSGGQSASETGRRNDEESGHDFSHKPVKPLIPYETSDMISDRLRHDQNPNQPPSPIPLSALRRYWQGAATADCRREPRPAGMGL